MFSVDLVSRVASIDETLSRFPGFGLVQFNCGAVRAIRFDTRDEKDVDFPENLAHAHVYHLGGTSRRKKDARELAKSYINKIIRVPDELPSDEQSSTS